MKKNTFITKLGTNKGTPRSRIWLEGRRLEVTGFSYGTRYTRIDHPTRTIITIDTAGIFKVSGKVGRPVIDMTGKAVTERFTGTHASVTFAPGRIVIANA
jgi:hypothetical protein